jgi:Zn-dependent protease with chaperone function
MNTSLDYKVNPNERILFYVRLLVSAGLYTLMIMLIVDSVKSTNPRMISVYVLYFYAVLVIVLLFIRFGVLIGYLKGNAVKLSTHQFPEIYQAVVKQSEALGLKSVPSVFILQSGGILNAFAARFLGRNYIVLFSEIVEAALEQDKTILEFIIGHELGHIRRNHMLKSLLLWPSYLVPFLGAAYSRACEYTCDHIGFTLCPSGVKSGLLLLASGKTIYKSVNVKAFLSQDHTEDGFWKWFAEQVSSHPNLTKRLALYADAKGPENLMEVSRVVEKQEVDHSRYMPR